VRLRVPVPEPSTSQAGELSGWATRVTQKVWETKSTWSKLKGKGKGKVNNSLFDEVWSEELAKLKAKRAAIQAMID
jgi:hypothetical protein